MNEQQADASASNDQEAATLLPQQQQAKSTSRCSTFQFWLLVMIRILFVLLLITLIVLGIIYRTQVSYYLSVCKIIRITKIY